MSCEQSEYQVSYSNGPISSRSSSAEPAGGAARFQTLVNYYRSDPRFDQDPSLLTFFSGDAFNPSLESTVTKGRHMVPFLNRAGTDVACVGVSHFPNIDGIFGTRTHSG